MARWLAIVTACVAVSCSGSSPELTPAAPMGADGGSGAGDAMGGAETSPPSDDSSGSTTPDVSSGPAPGSIGSPAPAPVAAGCVTDLTAGHRVVPCMGITHNLTVPAACLKTTCGLIFDVHGGTMSGDMEDKNTQLSILGPQNDYIVVQPNANNGLWNATTDDPLVYAFLQNVAGAFHVDKRHIHMTGLSQGGYMSWRFLCAHTDVFGSVAPAAAAGAANISIETGCTFTGTSIPTGEMDILYMHGTMDGLVNFQNAITLRDAVVAYYKMSAGVMIAGDGTYTRTRYKTASGRVFEFIQHNYLSSSSYLGVAIKGHCFPGSTDLSITLPNQLMSFGCNPPTSFTWGQEVMNFFKAHPKP
jgi:hypothetical protein